MLNNLIPNFPAYEEKFGMVNKGELCKVRYYLEV